MRRWSNKQIRVLCLNEDTNPFIVAYGATGSGKTACATGGFLHWAESNVPLYGSKTYGLVAKTGLQTRENVLPQCIEYAQEWGWNVRKLNNKSYVIGSNRFLMLDGANIQAADRIRGLDLAGAFVDEINTIHPRVVMEIENRVRSIPNGKIVATANPDNPLGWFRRDYIDNDKVKMTFHKLLWVDNPSLSEANKRRIEATSTGAFLRRRRDGEDAPLSGLIFINYTVADPPPDSAAYEWVLSVDPAASSTTHALLIGKFKDCYWVYDEWVWDGRKFGQMEHREQAKKIRDWLSDKTIAYGIVDSANPNFRLVLNDELRVPVYASVKGADSVIEGIALTEAWLEHGTIKINHKCKGLRSELLRYQWDETAAEKGEDKPLKSDDHACDALRQFCFFPHKKKVKRIFGYDS